MLHEYFFCFKKRFMKTGLFFILSLLFVGLTLSSCQENNISLEYPYEAEVIGKNTDCGLYEIKITRGLERVKLIVGPTPGEGIYIAENLPIELEVKGLKIKLDLRKPKAGELGLCTDMGPSYTWVFVTKAIKK